jgi:hypothetical protein
MVPASSRHPCLLLTLGAAVHWTAAWRLAFDQLSYGRTTEIMA